MSETTKYDMLISSRSKSVTMLFGITRDLAKRHEYFGTGFYIRLEKRVYIVTALHVAKRMKNYSHCFHYANGKTFPVMGGYVGCPVPQSDFAVVGCFHECFGEKDIPIDFSKIRPHFQKVSDHCLITGCPSNQLTQIPFLREASAKLNNVVSEIVGTSPDAKHVFVRYKSRLVNPPGMSGSPMWGIGYDRNGCVTEEEYHLSGIVTRWDADKEVVVATNGQVFLAYFERMVQEFTDRFPRKD